MSEAEIRGLPSHSFPDFASLIRATIVRAEDVSGTGSGDKEAKSGFARQPPRRPMPVRKVCFEIDVPARWAWHDHSPGSRRAHGAAYATYVGSWRKRFRITKGKAGITRYEDKASQTVRSFCVGCGTPLFYERARSPHM